MAEPVENNPSKIGYQVPGGCLVIFSMSVLVFAILKISGAAGLGTSLKSYFWESKVGTVQESDLRFHGSRGGSGTVRYTVDLDGKQIPREAIVSDDWMWADETKYKDWAAGYKPGMQVTVFVSSKGETSLGHWPTDYTWTKVLMGVFWIWFGLTNLRMGMKRLSSEREMRSASASSQSVK
jgi:hypothetical protein